MLSFVLEPNLVDKDASNCTVIYVYFTFADNVGSLSSAQFIK